MLPDGSGLDMCRDLRAQNSTIPIILLTALAEDVDRILGLEFGADDYLGKPFNPRELVARIRAVLRRQQEAAGVPAGNRIYKFASFEVETVRRRITNSNRQEIDLTSAEFDLLHALLARPGRLLSREQLLDIAGGRNSDPYDRSIDVLMSRIRRKLRDNGSEEVIKTVRNGGYRFTASGRDRWGSSMNSLRMRIALVLIISIVAVVGLATNGDNRRHCAAAAGKTRSNDGDANPDDDPRFSRACKLAPHTRRDCWMPLQTAQRARQLHGFFSKLSEKLEFITGSL